MPFGFGASTSTFGSTTTNNNSAQPQPQTQQFPPGYNPIQVPGAPDDSVSSLNFCPVMQNNNTLAYFCASSWASDVRLWELNTQNGQCQPKAQQTCKAPALDTAWSTDGTKIYVACADKGGYCWDIASNQMQQIAAHDEPISTINVLSMNGTDVIMTGSFDKKVRFWQLGNANPIAELILPFKIFAADACFPIAVCIGSDKGQAVITFESGKPEIKQKNYCNEDWPSKLNHQFSCVTVFKNKTTRQPEGFAVGATEGRSSLTYLNPQERKKVDPKNNNQPTWDPNFAFKCHRYTPAKVQVQVQNASGNLETKSNNNLECDAFTVNFIKFHPEYQTLVTAGSDGMFTFWDKDHRTKLGPTYKQGTTTHPLQFNMPLTAGDVSPDGKFFVLATGYDWSYGHEYSNLQKNKPIIYIHPQCVNEQGAEPGTMFPKNK